MIGCLFKVLYTKCWNKGLQCIWWQEFFDVPIKNKEETSEAKIEMSKNNDYTTDNLLDYIFQIIN